MSNICHCEFFTIPHELCLQINLTTCRFEVTVRRELCVERFIHNFNAMPYRNLRGGILYLGRFCIIYPELWFENDRLLYSFMVPVWRGALHVTVHLKLHGFALLEACRGVTLSR